MQRAIVVFPLPDSPTSATHAPRLDGEADVVGGHDRRPGGVRCDGTQAPRRPAAAPPSPSRGAASSRGSDAGEQRRLPAQAAHEVVRADRLEGAASPARRPRLAGRSVARTRSRRAVEDADGDAGDADQPPRLDVVGDARDQPARCTGGAARRRWPASGPPRRRARVHDRDAVGDATTRRRGRGRRRRARRRVSRCSRAISSRMRACVTTSSPVVGSSRTTSGGSQTSARAIARRCCWPPESWCGKRRWNARSDGSATRSRTVATRSSVAGSRPCAAQYLARSGRRSGSTG